MLDELGIFNESHRSDIQRRIIRKPRSFHNASLWRELILGVAGCVLCVPEEVDNSKDTVMTGNDADLAFTHAFDPLGDALRSPPAYLFRGSFRQDGVFVPKIMDQAKISIPYAFAGGGFFKGLADDFVQGDQVLVRDSIRRLIFPQYARESKVISREVARENLEWMCRSAINFMLGSKYNILKKWCCLFEYYAHCEACRAEATSSCFVIHNGRLLQFVCNDNNFYPPGRNSNYLDCIQNIGPKNGGGIYWSFLTY